MLRLPETLLQNCSLDGEAYAFTALRMRIAQLAAEGCETEREAAAWLLAEIVMRRSAGLNPNRRCAAERRILRLRYTVIEAT